MALNATYDMGLGPMPLHFTVQDYKTNLRTKTVAVRLEVYASGERRAARKAAHEALLALKPELDKAVVDRQTANSAYRIWLEGKQADIAALSAAFTAKPQDDREAGQAEHDAALSAAAQEIEAGRTSHEAGMLDAHKAIDAMKHRRADLSATFAASAPFREPLTVESLPDEVTFNADGSVGLPAIYAWLTRTKLLGGEQS